ncbi:hypothetical protein BC832DRAFT_221980 [Gaertneriomyces semiglobifer]|nr:hypothetical protein BC832DRAFT_221980 [Gaertneriomyces semiglobifer]
MKENGDGQEFLRDVDVLAVLKSSTFHVNGLSHGRPVLGVTLSVYEPALDRRTYRRLLRHCNKSDILNSGFEKQTVGLEHADVHNANPPQQRPMIEIASGNGKAAGGFQRNRWTKEQRIRYGEPASVGKLKLLLQKLLPLSDSRPHPASQTQLPTIPLKQISEDTTVAPTISQIEPALEKEEDNVQLVFSTGTKDHISPHHSLVIKPSVLRFTPNEPSQKFVLQNVTSRPIRYKIKQIRGGNFERSLQVYKPP